MNRVVRIAVAVVAVAVPVLVTVPTADAAPQHQPSSTRWCC